MKNFLDKKSNREIYRKKNEEMSIIAENFNKGLKFSAAVEKVYPSLAKFNTAYRNTNALNLAVWNTVFKKVR